MLRYDPSQVSASMINPQPTPTDALCRIPICLVERRLRARLGVLPIPGMPEPVRGLSWTICAKRKSCTSSRPSQSSGIQVRNDLLRFGLLYSRTPDVVDQVMCSGLGWRQGPFALLQLPTSLLSK